jgi:hypothetical protein
VLAPAKKGTVRDLLVTPVSAGAGDGVRLQEGSTDALILFRPGPAGELTTDELAADAAVAAWTRRVDGTEGLLLVEGTRWQSESGLALKATVPVSAELSIEKESVVGTVEHPARPGSQPYELTLQLGEGQSVKDVTSSHEVLDWQADKDTLKLTLAPGEHRLTIELN